MNGFLAGCLHTHGAICPLIRRSIAQATRARALRTTALALAMLVGASLAAVAPVRAAGEVDLHMHMVASNRATKPHQIEGKTYDGMNWVWKATVPQGQTVGIYCRWAIKLAAGVPSWSTKKAIPVQFVIKVDGVDWLVITEAIPAGTQLGGGKPIVFEPPSRMFEWAAKVPGRHAITCVLPAQLGDPDTANNWREMLIDVTKLELHPGLANKPTTDPAMLPAPGATRDGSSSLSSKRPVDPKPSFGTAIPTSPMGTERPPGFTQDPGKPVPAPAIPPGRVAPPPVERELASVQCVRARGDGLRFDCPTRAGLERCESLRMQRRVDHCASATRP